MLSVLTLKQVSKCTVIQSCPFMGYAGHEGLSTLLILCLTTALKPRIKNLLVQEHNAR